MPRLICNPEALRGLDSLIDYVARILARHTRKPVRKAEPKTPLARTA